MIKKLFKFIFKLLLWFIGLTVFWVLLYKFVPVPYTPLMAIRSIEGGKNYKTRHDWVPIEEISPYLQLAVICAEDQTFLSHSGFDREAIEKALKNNEKGKKLEAEVPSPNKPQRMLFSGQAVHGLEREWKPILPC